ncbi:MAG: hypothetical protein ACRC1H_19260 [Caldilineaceae bacterium]
MSERWVDALFARLAVRYGASWASKWAGLDIEVVKADWERVLGPLVARKSKAIRHVLDNALPEWPPTADQFLRLCANVPASDGALLALPPPRASDEVVAEIKRRFGIEDRSQRKIAQGAAA